MPTPEWIKEILAQPAAIVEERGPDPEEGLSYISPEVADEVEYEDTEPYENEDVEPEPYEEPVEEEAKEAEPLRAARTFHLDVRGATLNGRPYFSGGVKMDPFLEDLLAYARSDVYGPILRHVLEHEDAVVEKGGWHEEGTYDSRPIGWEWHDVNVQPGYLVRLAHAGIVGIVYKSNKHTDYRLTDPELVRKAISGELPEQRPMDEDVNEGQVMEAVLDLFKPIVGYEDVKALFVKALLATKPVHVLLEGPPSSAKTLFLMEVGRMPRSYFVVGGSSSKAGLTDMLVVYRPRYLLLDEVETIDNARDYSVLLHLMENEEVIETKYRRHNRIPLRSWVLGAGNDVSDLPPALMSRFGSPLRFKEYTSGEFVDVAVSILTMREGVPKDFAVVVLKACLALGSRDVRQAIRLARLASNEEELETVVETLKRRR